MNQKTVLNQTGWRECKKRGNHEEDSSYIPEETSELSGNQRQWYTQYNQWWQIQLWHLSE